MYPNGWGKLTVVIVDIRKGCACVVDGLLSLDIIKIEEKNK
jgi:hypothetical protein